MHYVAYKYTPAMTSCLLGRIQIPLIDLFQRQVAECSLCLKKYLGALDDVYNMFALWACVHMT
jgi:hypothetical protein